MDKECPKTPDIVESEDGYCSSFVSSDFIADNDIEACFSSEPNESTPNSSPSYSYSHQDDLMLNPLSPNQSFHNLEMFNVGPRPLGPPSPEGDLVELWNISPSDLQPLSPGAHSHFSDLEGILNRYSISPLDTTAQAQGSEDGDCAKRASPSYSPNFRFDEEKDNNTDKNSEKNSDKNSDKQSSKGSNKETDNETENDDESDASSVTTNISGYSTDRTMPYNGDSENDSDTSEAQE